MHNSGYKVLAYITGSGYNKCMSQPVLISFALWDKALTKNRLGKEGVYFIYSSTEKEDEGGMGAGH